MLTAASLMAMMAMMAMSPILSKELSAATPAEAALPSRCLVLSRYDTLTLLGPFAEICQTARAALGAKKKKVVLATQSKKAPKVVSGEGSIASKRPKEKGGSRKEDRESLDQRCG